MKTAQKICALALGSLLTLSLFAGCGSSSEEVTAARICYDNLGGTTSYISAADTTYTLKNVKSMTAVDGDGNTVEASEVATYANNTFTAVSEGVITCTLKNGKKFRLEVTPAYVTDPNTTLAYSQASSCHDPSLIEIEEDGAPSYYIFSTGWATGNEIRHSTDLMNWTLVGKSMTATTEMPEIKEWIGGENTGFIQWWAPDIVPAYGGGYWLYTCAVSNSYVKQSDGQNYSMACIVLFYSDTLEYDSSNKKYNYEFEYVGVLMQSCIPASNGTIDVNAIDPQIIYDESGKMYMAYGSFGTGNWMIELDAKTGLRKDSFYSDGEFLDWKTVRGYRDEAAKAYASFVSGKEIVHDYYGTMISYRNMEGPVIARHSNVKIADETATYNANGEPQGVKGATYYYSMHSYNGLAAAYQMWGGRSESVLGRYLSVNGSYIMNNDVGKSDNGGNKYMGSFTWADKSETSDSIDIILPGHNDLFTNSAGTNIAAYITRTLSYGATTYGDAAFLVQIHQYYLNSLGDICINPNRYAAEIDRSVSAEELFAFTDGGRFKMVALANDNAEKVSFEVVMTQNANDPNSGKISKDGVEIGTWLMYGKGYIKFELTTPQGGSRETVYYGLVRPAWLDDQNKSGFTIMCMGHTENETYSTAMFMNNISTLSGDGLVG